MMKLYTLDIACLERARRALARPGHRLGSARELLLSEADRLCRTPPESVVSKPTPAPGGDAHDYLSLAPDAWPTLRRTGGSGWQQRDGNLNPAAQRDDYDAARLARMTDRCLTLGAAWYFTGQRVYAQAAAEQIRCWFIDPETRMRPHLNYAHSVPGDLAGQGSGLYETASLWKVTDSLGLISTSGMMDAEDLAALRLWFGTFSDWMFNSPSGFEGYVWHDWRGTSHDAQRALYRLFCGDGAGAANVIRHGLTLRLAAQFDREGRQAAALDSDRPFSASLRNLEAHLLLNRYAEQVDIDRWNRVCCGRRVRAGLEYLLPFMREPDLWPWRDRVSDEQTRVQRVLLQALRGYATSGAVLREALLGMPEEMQARREWLLWYPDEREN